MEYSKTSYDPETNLYLVSQVDGEYRTKGPLNVGLQVTRRCNLKCIYCSEPPNLPDLSFSEIEKELINLKNAGVLKINITGGEALLREDIKDIVLLSKDLGFFVAMDSNATLMTKELADFLSDKLVYFESTIDGTPENHNRIRGSYDKIVRNIGLVSDKGIRTYIAMVLLGKSIEDAKHVLQVGNDLGATSVKFLLPIPKARGKTLPPEFLNNPYLNEIWEELLDYKKSQGLTPKISLADWRRIGNGSVMIINSNGIMVGSPSSDNEDCVSFVGNLLEESVEDMWQRYQYRENHIRKYNGETMLISAD